METLQPKLRFPEFDGNWENFSLGNIAKFSKGKGISKSDISDEGEFECIRYGELYTVYGETIKKIKSRTSLKAKDLIFSSYNDIIIPASGETQLDIATASCVLKDGIALGGDLNIIKTDNNGVFLSYYLNNSKKEDIASLAQGVSVVHLYSSQLSTLKLNLPSLDEQTRIANFLSSVDEKLNLLKEKKSLLEDYKKGIMQKIFNQEIRFKDDNGNDFEEWKNVNLQFVSSHYYQGINTAADKTKYYTEGFPILQAKHITSGKISYEDSKFINQSDFDLYKLKYKPNINEILISNIGTIGKVILITEDVDFLIAWNIFKVTLKPNISNAIFIMFNLKFISELGYFDECKTGNATKFVNKSDMLNTPLFLPDFEEQTKIANFLSTIDEKIELVSNQIQDTQEYKKGLLQQMFV